MNELENLLEIGGGPSRNDGPVTQADKEFEAVLAGSEDSFDSEAYRSRRRRRRGEDVEEDGAGAAAGGGGEADDAAAEAKVDDVASDRLADNDSQFRAVMNDSTDFDASDAESKRGGTSDPASRDIPDVESEPQADGAAGEDVVDEQIKAKPAGALGLAGRLPTVPVVPTLSSTAAATPAETGGEPAPKPVDKDARRRRREEWKRMRALQKQRRQQQEKQSQPTQQAQGSAGGEEAPAAARQLPSKAQPAPASPAAGGGGDNSPSESMGDASIDLFGDMDMTLPDTSEKKDPPAEKLNSSVDTGGYQPSALSTAARPRTRRGRGAGAVSAGPAVDRRRAAPRATTRPAAKQGRKIKKQTKKKVPKKFPVDQWVAWLADATGTSKADSCVQSIARQAAAEGLSGGWTYRNNKFFPPGEDVPQTNHPSLGLYRLKLQSALHKQRERDAAKAEFGLTDDDDDASEYVSENDESLAQPTPKKQASNTTPRLANTRAPPRATAPARVGAGPSTTSTAIVPAESKTITSPNRSQPIATVDAAADSAAWDRVRALESENERLRREKSLAEEMSARAQGELQRLRLALNEAERRAAAALSQESSQAAIQARYNEERKARLALESDNRALQIKIEARDRDYQSDLARAKNKLQIRHEDALATLQSQLREANDEVTRVKAKADVEQRRQDAQYRKAREAKQEEVSAAVARTREEMNQRLKHQEALAAQTLSEETSRHKRAVESLRQQHREELESLRRSQSDSTFVAGLMKRLEVSARTIEDLKQRVINDRSVQERAQLAQLKMREDKVREAETRVEEQRRNAMALMATFETLRRDNDRDKARLQEETQRLNALQSEMREQKATLQVELRTERQNLTRERAEFDERRSQLETALAHKEEELKLAREPMERLRNKMLKEGADLDKRKGDFARLVALEKKQLQHEAAVLEKRAKVVVAEERRVLGIKRGLRTQMQFLQQSQDEVTAAGARVKSMAEKLRQIHDAARSEREQAEKMWVEARSIENDADRLRRERKTEAAKLHQERLRVERAKLELFETQQSIMSVASAGQPRILPIAAPTRPAPPVHEPRSRALMVAKPAEVRVKTVSELLAEAGVDRAPAMATTDSLLSPRASSAGALGESLLSGGTGSRGLSGPLVELESRSDRLDTFLEQENLFLSTATG